MRRRAFLFGIDGLDPFHLEALSRRLPGFRRFLAESSWGILRSVFPPVSPAAWSSFFTGRPPEETGIFGWRKLLPDGRVAPVSRRDLRSPAVADYCGLAGKRFGSIGFPLGAPPHPRASVWVPGFSDAGGADLIRPVWVKRLLDSRLIRLELEPLKPPARPEDYDLYLRYRSRADEDRVRAAVVLFEELDLDLMMVLFTITDNVIHSGRDGRDLEAAYAAADRALGYLLDVLPENVLLIVASDHGIETKRIDVALDRFLHEIGLLRLAAASPSGEATEAAVPFESGIVRAGWSAVDPRRSRAIAIGCYGQIYPFADAGGSASEDRVRDVRRSILDRRAILRHPVTAELLVDDVEVLPRAELAGQIAPRLRVRFRGPDPVFVKTFPFTSHTPLASLRDHAFRGDHSPLGFWGIRGDGARHERCREESILSGAPALLRALGLRPPAFMAAPFGARALPAEASDLPEAGAETIDAEGSRAGDAEREIEARLAALGYRD